MKELVNFKGYLHVYRYKLKGTDLLNCQIFQCKLSDNSI